MNRAVVDGMSHLDVERAHVVGRSFSGAVALQLALDAPERGRHQLGAAPG